MMKKFVTYFLAFIFRLALRVRYKIEIKGREHLNPDKLNKSGGVLFLPNHPAALVDPAVATLSVFPNYPIRPMIIEYMYFTPFVHPIMKYLDALPIPNFETSNNSLKRKRYQAVLDEVKKGLRSGENFLLYPAGRLKHTAIEKIGGASAAHEIVHDVPQANVVLMRIKGLWGSSFSRALTGQVPPLLPTLKKGFWIALKNLIFFTPRRKVIVEIHPAPKDFPYGKDRLEFNRWLEDWYNQPDGLTEQEGERPGDSLALVSYSFWKKELPEVWQPTEIKEEEIEFSEIDPEIRNEVLKKLSELTERHLNDFRPDMRLDSDLGLDSLDLSELAIYLQDRFEIESVPIGELKTVRRVMGVASGKITFKVEKKEETRHAEAWEYRGEKGPAELSEGKTIPEVFLNTCRKMGKAPAIADLRSGVLTYPRMKLGVILLAEFIRKQPGKYIGILLPASVGAFLCVLATLLAGKVPLMINWTIGPRHLRAVMDISKVEVALTSWAFLERIDQVDLDGLDDKLVMLETVKREFSLLDKIKALFQSKRSDKAILKHFGVDGLTEEDQAVLLFTSGTEAAPKGVPLTHKNILSNLHSALATKIVQKEDVIYSFLPPFHSFGFTVTGLMGILSGVRIAYFPNPTDGDGLAREAEHWQATIICGAPTFLKAMLASAEPEELESMRICLSGAEAAPQDLLDLLKEFGKEECFLEGYGITECAPMVSVNRFGEPRAGVGRPLENVEILIVHPETYEKLSLGTEGLILIRGPNVFSDYLNPGLAHPFIEVDGKEWYNSGDLGYLDEKGRLIISGRKKRFIKVGGEMVSLSSIESALIEAAPSKGWKGKQEGPILALLAKEQAGEKPVLQLICTFNSDVQEVNQIIRDRGFSNLVRISKVAKVDEIPLMGTGKINYRTLEEKYFQGKEGGIVV